MAEIIENGERLIKSIFLVDVTEKIISVIEIIIIAYIIYSVLQWIKSTGAWSLLKGIGVIIVMVVLANVFKLKVLSYIFSSFGQTAIIVFILIFQNDIRAGIEHIGRQNLLTKLIPDLNRFGKKISADVIHEITEASFEMGKVKTGALIVLEKTKSLEDVEMSGIIIDGKVTKQLLINIFEKNTPLHDGAVLIVGDKVKAATCYLPLSKNNTISKALGTRHRAALGISETSDAITVVVSEETGRVSCCVDGEITVMNDEKQLIAVLNSNVLKTEESSKKGIISTVKGWFIYEK